MSVRGTRNLVGSEARAILDVITHLRLIVERVGFEPFIPSTLADKETFVGQIGDNRMYEFQDRSERELVLIPEVTAIAKQEYMADPFNFPQRIWYAQRCYRYDKPQRGRYREFWQFGVEIFKPTPQEVSENSYLMEELIRALGIRGYEMKQTVERGQVYYKGNGYEVWKGGLQLGGGGAYENGVGFAIGLERCLLVQ